MQTQAAHPVALEKALLEPEHRTSPGWLDRVLADGFVDFGASGRRFDKQACIAMLSDESGVRLEAGEIEVRDIAPGVVLLLYVSTRRADGGSARAALRSLLWRESPAGWQLIFHQGTLTTAAGAQA